MNAKRAVIIGYDAVSPLGIDLEGQWQSALKGQSGIGPLSRFEADGQFPVKIAGQVPEIDHLPYPFLKPRERARWVSPIFKYALLTVQRALDRCGLEITSELAPPHGYHLQQCRGGIGRRSRCRS